MRILVLTWRDLAHSAAGGAEVYTEQVDPPLGRRRPRGHALRRHRARPPQRGDGRRLPRRPPRGTADRLPRRPPLVPRERPVGQFDVVIDMVNTVPFKAHEWITDTPVIAFFHQTAEECWHFNSPAPRRHARSLRPRAAVDPRLPRSHASWSSRSRRPMRSPASACTTRSSSPRASSPSPSRTCRRRPLPTVVWCARLVPYKRPQDVVEAARIAREQHPGPPGLDHGRRTDARGAAQDRARRRRDPRPRRARMTRSSAWPVPTCTSPPAPARAGAWSSARQPPSARRRSPTTRPA